ncbi:MHO_1580 family protein [Mycoplasma phocoeninasale]
MFYNPWDNNHNKEIIIDSYSYYDNKSKKTIISANDKSSEKGIILPLDFYGNFFYEMDISFGEKLKKFSLVYNQYIPKPFFDKNIGLVDLKIKNIKGWLTKEKWHTVKYDKIEQIVKNAKNLEEISKIGGGKRHK